MQRFENSYSKVDKRVYVYLKDEFQPFVYGPHRIFNITRIVIGLFPLICALYLVIQIKKKRIIITKFASHRLDKDVAFKKKINY